MKISALNSPLGRKGNLLKSELRKFLSLHVSNTELFTPNMERQAIQVSILKVSE